MNEDTLNFYVTQSKYTSLGDFLSLVESVPNNIEAVCKCARNVIEHFHGLNSKKISLSRFLDVDLRCNATILERIKKSGYENIVDDISFNNKIIGTCRMQAVFACGLLRAKGIPARVRYKYCTYFIEDFNHEQVVVEYWCSKIKKWMTADPAMNHEVLEQKKIKIDFDLCQVPADKSMTISTAWKKCRRQLANPDSFGAYNQENRYNGYKHIRKKLYHDLACLNKVEVVEWDRWGPFLLNDYLFPEEESYCDYLADIMDVPDLNEQALYQNISFLREKIIPVTGESMSPFNGNYPITF